MKERDIVRRLVAFARGRPLPRGETKQVYVGADRDVLIVAFIRMGGESRPWGIAYGHPNTSPAILTVPEGRNRDLVADMCAAFAPTLLSHVRTPSFVDEPAAGWENLRPLRQLWLPNGSHIDMLHHLAFAYTFTRWRSDASTILNPLGRAAGWLFREAQRPGEQHVIAATDALRAAYTFPAQPTRLEHLGFLLAWLDDDLPPDQRLAAAHEAEDLAMSTTLDPMIERSHIENPLEEWHTARNDGDADRGRAAEATISDVLKSELRHRYQLTVKAIHRLRDDERRVNRGVTQLVTEGLKEQWYQHTRLEIGRDSKEDGPAFTPSPETDRYPAAAGSRYMVHLASADIVESVLLHDDSELQAETIARGDGFRGTILDVENRSDDRRIRPVWTLRNSDPGPLRLRRGSWVCVIGLPQRTAKILSVADEHDGSRTFEIEITGWKTRPQSAPQGTLAATDSTLVGHQVGFVKSSASGISRTKSIRIWSANNPGSWLTHARPAGPRTTMAPDVGEDIASITRT